MDKNITMLLDLKKLIPKYNMAIKGVVYIGAHVGTEIGLYTDLNIKNIVMFEPVPSTYEKLKLNVGDKATLINKALGNENRMVEMNIETANAGQSSSILEPALHLNQYPHITFNSKQEVEMARLDDVELPEADYNFMTIDVQGYELEVFKGGKEFLNQIDYIVCEVNRAEVYSGCPLVEELDEFLAPYGFERVETSWDGNIWGDAMYIKK
jgi:FkbM family methyltransferase